MIIEVRPLIERWKFKQVVRTKQPPHVTLIYNFKCKKCAYRTLGGLKKMPPTYAVVNGAEYRRTNDGYLAYFRVEPSSDLLKLKRDLSSMIRNYSTQKDYEYTINNFWHMTIEHHTTKNRAKKLAKHYKNFVYPITVIRITYIENMKIWLEYDLLKGRVYNRRKALRTKNWSEALPLKNPFFRVLEDDDRYYTTYVISDTHFGHDNIIKYASRPFITVREMDEYMIDEWNSVVSQEDTIIHLGDLVFKGNPKNYLKRLNGNIYLVPGNHDKPSILKKYGVKILDDRNFFHKLVGVPPFVTINGIKFSHYPSAGRVFGHVHTSNLRDYPFFSKNGINVSVEVVNYRPMPLDKLLSLLKN